MLVLEAAIGLFSWMVIIMVFGLLLAMRHSDKVVLWLERQYSQPHRIWIKPRPPKLHYFGGDGPTSAEITMAALSGRGAFHDEEEEIP